MRISHGKGARAAWLLAASLVLTIGVHAGGIGEGSAEAPRPAMEFVFEDVNPASASFGETLALADLYAEGGLVLNFLASWCTYCWEELPDLERLHVDGSAPVVGIAADEYSGGTAVLLPLVEKTKLTIPILFVPSGKSEWMETFYDHPILPATYIIDRDGAVRQVLQGAVPRKKLLAAIDDGLGG